MTNHPNRSKRATYAVIVADSNSTAIGEIVSTHRTLLAAGQSLRKLAYPRWAYVAQQRPDGSYPHRVEGMDLPAHAEAIEQTLTAEHWRGR